MLNRTTISRQQIETHLMNLIAFESWLRQVDSLDFVGETTPDRSPIAIWLNQKTGEKVWINPVYAVVGGAVFELPALCRAFELQIARYKGNSITAWQALGMMRTAKTEVQQIRGAA